MKYSTELDPDKTAKAFGYELHCSRKDAVNISYAIRGMKSEDAKKYLQKAVLLNPNDVNSLSVFGFTLSQLNEENEALKYINKALSIDPDNVQLLGMAGMIYDNKEMWAECDSVYQKAIEIDSTNVVVLNNFAYSLAERGIRLDEALEMVSYSLKQEPENSSYLDTIGWVYFKMGEYQKAVPYIEKAFSMDKQNSEVIEHLGDVKFKLEFKEEAIKLWEEALELDQNNKLLKEKIERGFIK